MIPTGKGRGAEFERVSPENVEPSVAREDPGTADALRDEGKAKEEAIDEADVNAQAVNAM